MQIGIIKLYVDTDVGTFLRNICLRHIHAGRSIIGHGDVAFLGHNELHGTVDAAVHAKEPVIDRDDVRTLLIISKHNNLIHLTILQCFAYLNSKGRICPLMGTKHTLVDINFRTRSHALKAKEHTFTLQLGGAVELFAIVGFALVKAVIATLHIFIVPSMGNAYRLPLSVPFGRGKNRFIRIFASLKLPPVAKRLYFAGICAHCCEQPQTD